MSDKEVRDRGLRAIRSRVARTLAKNPSDLATAFFDRPVTVVDGTEIESRFIDVEHTGSVDDGTGEIRLVEASGSQPFIAAAELKLDLKNFARTGTVLLGNSGKWPSLKIDEETGEIRLVGPTPSRPFIAGLGPDLGEYVGPTVHAFTETVEVPHFNLSVGVVPDINTDEFGPAILVAGTEEAHQHADVPSAHKPDRPRQPVERRGGWTNRLLSEDEVRKKPDLFRAVAHRDR